ncbi:MAG: hypothetical protein Q8P59_06400, partial [Dehalococcoidia bacterium]|nr:hypothetical protein [Dehalococcoidia bacterium]
RRGYMDAETTNKPSTSFDVFAVSKEGFEVHFQLFGEKAYCHALKLLEAMSKDGFTPRMKTDARPKGNATKTQDKETAVCTLHKATMKRHENEKGTWFSHKLADGTYCNGKAA